MTHIAGLCLALLMDTVFPVRVRYLLRYRTLSLDPPPFFFFSVVSSNSIDDEPDKFRISSFSKIGFLILFRISFFHYEFIVSLLKKMLEGTFSPIITAGMKDVSLHSECSLSGQSGERVWRMERLSSSFALPITHHATDDSCVRRVAFHANAHLESRRR